MHGSFDTLLTTISLAIFVGSFILILGKVINIPTIPILLIAGVVLGKEGLGIINIDVFGQHLKTFISIAIAVILFEGGLTLDYSGYRQMSKAIKRLLTIGIFTTWVSISLFIYWLFRYPLAFCFLCGSLVIVTGPTVITPILRRIRPNKNVHQTLLWEAVLIDPIGVFLSILCFEIVTQQVARVAVSQFLLQFTTGLVGGFLVGSVSVYVLKKKWIPEDHVNIFILAVAISTYGFCDFLVEESGLLAVVIIGSFIGIQKPVPIENIKKFKLELTRIFVALVFILLASSLELSRFALLGGKGVLLVLFVILVSRPLAIFLSTFKTGLKFREKIFISWLAPRGIIVASMSALFGISLRESGYEYAWFLETFTFMVITVTVLLQGFSAGVVAKILKVQRSKLNTCVIVGIHSFSIEIANFLKKRAKKEVILLDKNKNKVELVKKNGHNAYLEDAMDSSLLEEDKRFVDVGSFFALTENEDLNALLAKKWSQIVESKEIYFWKSSRSVEADSHQQMEGNVLWQRLPKPSILSYELEQGDSHVMISNRSPRMLARYIFLMGINRENLFVDRKTFDNLPKKTEYTGLYLKRTEKTLKEMIKKELVFFLLAKTYKTVLSKSVDKIISEYPHLSKKNLLQEFLTSKEQSFINLNEGIGLTCLFVTDILSPIFCVVKLRKQILIQDKKMMKLLFIIVAPSSDREGRIHLLSSVTNFLVGSKRKQKLLNGKNNKELFKILRSNVVS